MRNSEWRVKIKIPQSAIYIPQYEDACSGYRWALQKDTRCGSVPWSEGGPCHGRGEDFPQHVVLFKVLFEAYCLPIPKAVSGSIHRIPTDGD